ncbi:O-antigen ligase family protein [Staphylococcus equorum]|uniref:O-antigen ligase family protein n=1 Tax=Staphylococcus equorum TaxID=246432 RepID=UPI000852D74A|nr:O-antigen ligase family protein [Staphylococcus equorum]OEK64249.1 hypothetical protein ASS98_03565 [Staphylococcus equorum]
MNSFNLKIGNAKILFIVITLYLLFPSPFENFQFITYPAVSIIILILLLSNYKNLKVYLNKELLVSIFGLLSLSFFIGLSILINREDYTFSSLVHMFKPIFFIAILLFSYIFSYNCEKKRLANYFVVFATFILMMQLFISITQLLNIDLFTNIYNSSKAQGIGTKIRVVGSLSNPNILAWVTTQLMVMILLFSRNKLFIIFMFIVSFSIIILTSSRSFLILMPIIMILVLVIKRKKNISFYLIFIPITVLGSYLIFKFIKWFIYSYQDVFPYIYQLTSVFETGELKSVNSFNMRLVIWQNSMERIGDSFLFGLGPGVIRSLDNDFLYALVNYGVLYLIIQTVLYLVFCIFFYNNQNENFKIMGIINVIFALIVGLQADTISGWFYPVLTMFILGVSLSSMNNNYKNKQS